MANNTGFGLPFDAGQAAVQPMESDGATRGNPMDLPAIMEHGYCDEHATGE